MLLPALLSLVVLQQPTSTTASQTPIARVDVQPSGGEVPIGGKMKFSARALDASGQVVPGAEIGWFVGGDIGDVDSTGEFTGGDQGYARVTAVGITPRGDGREGVGAALVHVLPQAPARVVSRPRPERPGFRSRPPGSLRGVFRP